MTTETLTRFDVQRIAAAQAKRARKASKRLGVRRKFPESLLSTFNITELRKLASQNGMKGGHKGPKKDDLLAYLRTI